MILAKILFDDRTAHQYEGRDPEDLDLLVQTILPQTRSIPIGYLYESYVVALEQRRPEDNFQIRGVELLNGWKVIQGRVEMESKGAYADKSRLLPEYAAKACVRCFGTGMERMPDGTVRPGCQHTPMTKAEESEIEESAEDRAKFVQDQAAFMREALSKIGKPKPVETAPQPKPKGQALVCDGCGRKVNTYYMGFEVGSACGDLLNKGDYDGEPKLCEGVFRCS